MTPEERELLHDWLDIPAAERPQGHPAAGLLRESAAARAYLARLDRLDRALAAAFAASVPDAAEAELKRRLADVVRHDAPRRDRRSVPWWASRQMPWTWTLLPAAACVVVCAVMLWRTRPTSPAGGQGRDIARESGITAESEPSPEGGIVRGSEVVSLSRRLDDQPIQVIPEHLAEAPLQGGRAGGPPGPGTPPRDDRDESRGRRAKMAEGRAPTTPASTSPEPAAEGLGWANVPAPDARADLFQIVEPTPAPPLASAPTAALTAAAPAEVQPQATPASDQPWQTEYAGVQTRVEAMPIDAVWRVRGAPEQWDTLNSTLNQEPAPVRLLSANVPPPEPAPTAYWARAERGQLEVEQAQMLFYGHQASAGTAPDRRPDEGEHPAPQLGVTALPQVVRAVPEPSTAGWFEEARPDSLPAWTELDSTGHLLANLGLLVPAPVDLAMAGDAALAPPQWVIQGTQTDLDTLRRQLDGAGVEVVEEPRTPATRAAVVEREEPQFLNVIVLWEQPVPAAPPATAVPATVAGAAEPAER